MVTAACALNSKYAGTIVSEGWLKIEARFAFSFVLRGEGTRAPGPAVWRDGNDKRCTVRTEQRTNTSCPWITWSGAEQSGRIAGSQDAEHGRACSRAGTWDRRDCTAALDDNVSS
jgi:hypothetical protein